MKGVFVSMPSRAFLLFGHIRVTPLIIFSDVSMPSRAFLLFGLAFKSSGDTARATSFNALAGIFAFRTRTSEGVGGGVSTFQCPRGHFCFSDPCGGRVRLSCMAGFNALAGIFAFRTLPRGADYAPLSTVSMPSRAFLLFGRIYDGGGD